MPAPYSTALFDLDGTISDSYLGFHRSVNHALAAVGVAAAGDVREYLGPPLDDSLDRLGVPADRVADALAAYRERYWTVGFAENEVYDGIPQALAALAAAGVRLLVATAKPEPSARKILEHFGLVDAFDDIVGATYDGRVSHKHEVIAELLSRHDGIVPADTVMIGDRHHDMHGATQFGIGRIGVLWGFGDAAELRTAGAEELAEHPLDLVPLVVGRP